METQWKVQMKTTDNWRVGVGAFLGSVSTPGTTDSVLSNQVCWANVKQVTSASLSCASGAQRPHWPIQTSHWCDFQNALRVLLESASRG